jgi:uncharacterized protein (TIGR00156 family)
MSMKTLWAVLAATLLLGGGAAAQFVPNAETASGTVSTAADAREAADETPVVLTGRIVERLRAEHYRFVDDTGEIRLDVSEEIWRGVRVDPQTPVRVTGETDRALTGMEIWVHSIEVIDE